MQQRGLNHPQIDGKASVAPPGGRIGQTAYFILRLGARFATRFPQARDDWGAIRNLVEAWSDLPQRPARRRRAAIPALRPRPEADPRRFEERWSEVFAAAGILPV